MQLCTFLSWLFSWCHSRRFHALEAPRHVGYCMIKTTTFVLALITLYPKVAAILSVVLINSVAFVIWIMEKGYVNLGIKNLIGLMCMEVKTFSRLFREFVVDLQELPRYSRFADVYVTFTECEGFFDFRQLILCVC